jgi:hypothetical protein
MGDEAFIGWKGETYRPEDAGAAAAAGNQVIQALHAPQRVAAALSHDTSDARPRKQGNTSQLCSCKVWKLLLFSSSICKFQQHS